ncbi:MAG: hypothetical protein H6Q44_1078, partial [Deltaproteobacteria bacterium]|nr:hypothetical protein [Deltaproteobacteria bacterium]
KCKAENYFQERFMHLLSLNLEREIIKQPSCKKIP